ncbi:lactate/malate family dehydrogenase [Vibrio algarum]|uniref:L-lactate dehydrogenase n=1 Tax=Vibrio algarum TaxID=3020714 RepID=A0ABT4YQL2_9VIBR|nr:L-lactate dehydrogenase [Vibrio sp. KJ40-1]MDB1123851.1 L-lactate dehydrogenase [Vibrio sp. KJ40-1]
MKIGVIGAGSVGVGICNYLLTLGSVSELSLLDLNKERAEGEILDFSHTNALTFSKNTRLKASDDYEILKASDIVVITAGAQIKEGQNRLDLAEINSKICVDIAKQVEKVAPDAILIIVTNPCDIVTYFIAANTSYTASQVISAGCLIDTARLMTIVAKKADIDPKNVFGYVLGEHGSHCFTPKSLISIAGQPADYYCETNGVDKIDADKLLDEVRQVGFEIFTKKQNTTHGIAASVFRIVQAIMIDEKSVLPVGTLIQGQYGLHDVVLSLPTIISRKGAEKILIHPFESHEKKQLDYIASELKALIIDVAGKTGLMK